MSFNDPGKRVEVNPSIGEPTVSGEVALGSTFQAWIMRACQAQCDYLVAQAGKQETLYARPSNVVTDARKCERGDLINRAGPGWRQNINRQPVSGMPKELGAIIVVDLIGNIREKCCLPHANGAAQCSPGPYPTPGPYHFMEAPSKDVELDLLNLRGSQRWLKHGAIAQGIAAERVNKWDGREWHTLQMPLL